MFYRLISENISELSRTIGILSGSVSENWRRYYLKKKNAKKAAQKDYDTGFKKEKRKKIKWKKNKQGVVHSSDLGFVMYSIKECVLEDE